MNDKLKMTSPTILKKWQFRLIQVVFLIAFLVFLVIGVLGLLYEDDMHAIGFFWATILALIYWLMSLLYRKTKRR